MKVGIIGAGTMGGGIAQVFAQGGWSVCLCDISEELAAKGKSRIAKGFEKRIAKGSGVAIQDVNRLLSQFEQMKKMLKMFTGKRGKKRGGMMGLPF